MPIYNAVIALVVQTGVLLGLLLLTDLDLYALVIANMWVAIFADVGVMIIAVLNAIRALFVNNL